MTSNAKSTHPLETLEGILERVTFQSETTGYAVFKLKIPRSPDLVTAVGTVPVLHPGESLRMRGFWSFHPKHGSQFKVIALEKMMPATAVGLEKYLASGLIRGVGPVTAQRMVEKFGTEIIAIIESQPDQLLRIPLIGPRKRDLIVRSWQEHREIQNVMLFLQAHGVSTTYAVKIYKAYGNQAIAVVEANPYQLAEDIWGIGFKTADQLACRLGHAVDSPFRLRAGLLYALQRASQEGHVFLPMGELLTRAAELLTVDTALFSPVLEELGRGDQLVMAGDPEQPDVYLATLWQSEQGVACRLKRMLSTPVGSEDEAAVWTWLAAFEQQQLICLAPEQRQAVVQAAVSPVFILTGGPGTGKTTVSRAILAWFESRELKLLLASPTGRAAKRLAEVSGHPASTLHRLLAFDPARQRFRHDEQEPLDCQVLLLDEVSMIDTPLFYALLRALPEGCRLILVGDSDQLPSVGPGDVLRHVCMSGKIPAVTLREIFRQAQSSLIVRNAHRVNQGQFPQLLPPLPRHRREDCFFLAAETPEELVERVCELMVQRLPAVGYQLPEIQVLCPMNRGPTGAHALNQVLQQALNPPESGKAEFMRGSRLFRVGDRLIQLRNNYDREVFNGDLGQLVAIDVEEQRFRIAFPEGEVDYDFSDSDELALAYALSVHKSQGSEYPVVILPISRQYYLMLQRNLLYTAMTRARQLLILVGQPQAIARAVKNHAPNKRYSRLAERL